MDEELIKQMLEELDVYSRDYNHPFYGLPVMYLSEMNEMIKIVRKYEKIQDEILAQDDFFNSLYR